MYKLNWSEKCMIFLSSYNWIENNPFCRCALVPVPFDLFEYYYHYHMKCLYLLKRYKYSAFVDFYDDILVDDSFSIFFFSPFSMSQLMGIYITLFDYYDHAYVYGTLMKEKARVSYSIQIHNQMDFAPKTTYSVTFKGIEKCYEYALIPTKRN